MENIRLDNKLKGDGYDKKEMIINSHGYFGNRR